MPVNTAHPQSPHHLARGKYFALAGLLGLGLAGFWHSVQSDLSIQIDQGQDNEDHRILIWASGDKGIEEWLNKQVMTTGHYAYRKDPSPVLFDSQRAPEGLKAQVDQAPEPQKLDEVLAWADQHGFAYVAFDLAGPGGEASKQMIERAAPAHKIPRAARWAVISSNRRQDTLELSFGSIQPGISFSAVAGPRASLMQALFADARLGQFRRPVPVPVPVKHSFDTQDLSQRGLDFSTFDWRAFSYPELTLATMRAWPNYLSDPKVNREQAQWLASPMQRARAQELNDSVLVVATTPLVWYSQEGHRAKLRSDANRQGWTLSLLGREGDGLRAFDCEGFPDKAVLTMRTGNQGDALLIRGLDNSQEIYALEFDEVGRCRAELRSRLELDESDSSAVLGVPDAHGRSSWLVADQDLQTLAWRGPGGRGRVRLPKRHFVRGRWQWKSRDELHALTRDPRHEESGEAALHFEIIRLDPQSEQGIERRTMESYPDLESAAHVLPAVAPWPELSQTDRLHFGARSSQAIFSPNPS